MLNIDQNFQTLIPPLSPDELTGLTQSIIAHGRPRDALIVWKGTIIDGHNRYAICQQHNLPYSTKEMRFPSKKEAELWIIQNQLGRRNLTDATRLDLAHRKALLQKPRNGIRRAVAKETGKSEQTVQKFMTLKKLADPELLAKLYNGELKISAAYAMVDEPMMATITTITEMHVESTPEADEERRLHAIYSNTDRLARLYDFLMDVPVGDGDDFSGVCRGVKRLLAR